MSQNKSLSSFGHDFQTKIFKCIIEDKLYGTSILQILKLTYFSQQKFKILFNKIKQYHYQYQTIPNYSTLKVIINSIDKQDLPQILDLVNKMQQDYSADQLLFVKKESLKFCRNQQMRDAIVDSVDLLNDGNMQGIWQRFNRVMKVTMDGDIGTDMIQNFNYISMSSNRNVVSTGYELLDKEFNGGIGKGQLAVVMAPTGCGKSQFMINIAKGALLRGKVAVYITLQLSQDLVKARMASLLSGVPINNLHEKKDQVIQSIKYFYQKSNSKFIVKHYPTKSIGVSTIKTYLNKLRSNGIIPNIVFVDYADLLKPMRISKQKRRQLQQLYQGLRQLSGVQNVPVWTATQTNRSAIEQQVIGAGAVAESFGKLFVADQVLSISRTTQDKIAGTGKLHIIKNRSGNEGDTFSLNVDTSRCIFVLQRKLGADQFGHDTNKILTDFKAQRQGKAKTRMQRQLDKFLKKNKEDKK